MNPVDSEILLWLNGFVGAMEPFDDAMRLLAGDYLVPITLSLALLGAWFAARDPERRMFWQKRALVGMAALGLANLLVTIVNGVWHRPRPFVPFGDEVTLLFYPPTDPAFPANPTAVGFAVVAALWSADIRIRWALILLASLFGFARLYAGVFYPTDIIGGAVVGTIAAYIARLIFWFFDPIVGSFIRVARAFVLA